MTATTTAAPIAEGKIVEAQMPGTVIRIEVMEGTAVKSGDTLLVQEAMKMEVEIKSPVDGVVTGINVAAGDQVTAGQILVNIG